MKLLDEMFGGAPEALARAISLVEEGGEPAREIVRVCYPRAGTATVIGVTGPPGVGKSTLVNGLTRVYRRNGKRVAILAVDPSSSFSGGAILGDRVRMQDHAGDPGVFIRSMATRGHAGGVAGATADAIDLAAAAGWDPILIETLGAGQDEIEVAELADPVLVVLMPGQGDDIQAIKAGLLEIADLFVINKSDLPGGDRLERELRHGAPLTGPGPADPPPVVRTVALRDEGIETLAGAIEEYRRRPRSDRRRRQTEHRLLTSLRERILAETVHRTRAGGAWEETVRALMRREIDPYRAVDRLLHPANDPAAGKKGG